MSEVRKTKETTITLRPVADGDREFLLTVYEASRETELSMVQWDAAMRRTFVEHQFDAQTRHYEGEYHEIRHDIILFGDDAVGRLFMSCGDPTQIAIMDITILPKYRQNGIGTRIVNDLKGEASASNRSLRIYIEDFNPSQGLFRKLGFESVETDTVNLLLEWRKPDT